MVLKATSNCWNSPRTVDIFDTSSFMAKAEARRPMVFCRDWPLLSSSRICLSACAVLPVICSILFTALSSLALNLSTMRNSIRTGSIYFSLL